MNQKKKLPQYLKGKSHVYFNMVLLVGASLFFLRKIHSPTFVELLIVPFVLLAGNLVVYLLHRYPLHIRYSFFTYPYEKHTVEHHTQYTYDNMLFKGLDELSSILFPPEVVLGFVVIFMPVVHFAMVSWATPNAIYMLQMCSALYFLLYELLHGISHLPEDHVLLKIKWLRFMWNHHRIHHIPSVMNTTNFNIVYPLFDYLFGTLVTDVKEIE